MHTVLYVCSGNTCRSPMAEAIARHWTTNGLLGDVEVFVASAGTASYPGLPVSDEVARTLGRWDIVHEGASKPLSADMIREATIVFCMTASHVAAARALVAGDEEADAKIVRLDPDGDLDDPIGMGQSAYDALAERLMEVVPARLKELLSDANRSER